MTKTDSYANHCVQTDETVDSMSTSEVVEEADSQTTDVDQSTTSIANYSRMEFQCVDSEKTFDKSIEQERSQSMKPLSMAQKILMQDEKERDQKSNRSTLLTKANVKSQINWPSSLQWRYSQKVQRVGGVTSTPEWRQMLNVIKSRSTATSTSTKWKPTTFGTKSINADQATSTSGTDSLMEFQRFDHFDSNKTTDEFSGHEFSPTFQSLALAHKMLGQGEKDKKLEYKRNTLIQKSKERSQMKSPLLQMHYSQAVSSMGDIEAKDLYRTSIPSWREQRNYKNSPRDSSKVIDSPQPSTKGLNSVELNETGYGSSREDFSLSSFLYSLQDQQPTTTQDEYFETSQSNKELTKELLLDASCVTEVRSTVKLAPAESKPTISASESTDADRNVEIMKSTPVTETQIRMQPIEFIHSTPNNGNGSIEERQILPPQSLKEYDRSNMSVPSTARSDAMNEAAASVAALWDHSYYKSIEARNAAKPEYSPVKFSHPTINKGGESTEQTNTLLPESPKELDRASTSIPAITQSYALTEIVTSAPAVSDYTHHEPIEAKNTVAPQPPCSTTSIGNESDDLTNIWPPESTKEFDRASTSIPATTQSYALNEIVISAPAPSDYSFYKPIKAENTAKSQLSPVNFIHPTTNIDNESIEQTNTWPPQSLNEFNPSAATQSDTLNEILISVPTPSDYSYNKPIDVENSATATLPLNQQNFVQTPNAIKPTTSGVNSSAKTRKRPYKRSNKVLIQSDELIMPPPPVGSIIRTLPNNAVRINSNQVILDPKPSNVQKNVKPIQMTNMKVQVKDEIKSNPPTLLTSSKRKNTENILVHVPLQANVKFPMKNEPKSSTTATIATSLKRKNKENLPLRVPAKVQKMTEPIQGTMTNVATSSISVNLPDITIERIDMVQEDKRSSAVTSPENRSFSDCIKFLARNNVTVFKVPRNPQPPNKVLDKYLNVFQKNGVHVKRVNKNTNRI